MLFSFHCPLSEQKIPDTLQVLPSAPAFVSKLTQQDGKKCLSHNGFRERFENFFMVVLPSS